MIYTNLPITNSKVLNGGMIFVVIRLTIIELTREKNGTFNTL